MGDESKYTEKIYEEKKNYGHITPLFSALDSSNEKSKVISTCERPCVCVCVCRHGKSSSLDFSRKRGLERKTETLFREALTT